MLRTSKRDSLFHTLSRIGKDDSFALRSLPASRNRLCNRRTSAVYQLRHAYHLLQNRAPSLAAVSNRRRPTQINIQAKTHCIYIPNTIAFSVTPEAIPTSNGHKMRFRSRYPSPTRTCSVNLSWRSELPDITYQNPSRRPQSFLIGNVNITDSWCATYLRYGQLIWLRRGRRACTQGVVQPFPGV